MPLPPYAHDLFTYQTIRFACVFGSLIDTSFLRGSKPQETVPTFGMEETDFCS